MADYISQGAFQPSIPKHLITEDDLKILNAFGLQTKAPTPDTRPAGLLAAFRLISTTARPCSRPRAGWRTIQATKIYLQGKQEGLLRLDWGTGVGVRLTPSRFPTA